MFEIAKQPAVQLKLLLRAGCRCLEILDKHTNPSNSTWTMPLGLKKRLKEWEHIHRN